MIESECLQADGDVGDTWFPEQSVASVPVELVRCGEPITPGVSRFFNYLARAAQAWRNGPQRCFISIQSHRLLQRLSSADVPAYHWDSWRGKSLVNKLRRDD